MNRPFTILGDCSPLSSEVGQSENLSQYELDWLTDQGIVRPCLNCDDYHPGHGFTVEDVDRSIDEMRDL